MLLATTTQPVFRQRFCKVPHCRSLFFICSHCDRGQIYCSPDCRKLSRREQLRAAGRRHQQSQEGRLDHRDRQRAYRLRKAASASKPSQKSVTDHTSHSTQPSATLCGPIRSLPQPARSAFERLRQALCCLGLIVCQVCGRVGRFLNPFHEGG